MSDHKTKTTTKQIQKEESKPTKLNFSIGKPVKAKKYYSLEHSGFVRNNNDEPLYVQGRKKNGKIAHISDVKGVIQATNSDVLFIHSNGEMDYPEMKELVSKTNLINPDRLREVRMYDDGELIKGLTANPEDTPRNFKNWINRFEEIEGISPEYFEKESDHFYMFVESEVKAE